MQLEQEYEEKQMALHEKQDLEGLIGTLCDQVRGRRREQTWGSTCPARTLLGESVGRPTGGLSGTGQGLVLSAGLHLLGLRALFPTSAVPVHTH